MLTYGDIRQPIVGRPCPNSIQVLGMEQPTQGSQQLPLCLHAVLVLTQDQGTDDETSISGAFIFV